MIDSKDANSGEATSGAGDGKPSREGGEGRQEAQLEGAGAQAAGSLQELERRIVDVLKTCYDPEIPVNIYELGLIYNVDLQPEGSVNVRMTLTSPMCPVAGSLPPEVESKIRNVPGVTSAKVEVVWEPPWTPAMMSEVAKLQLNMM